jgi:hypothetical protein
MKLKATVELEISERERKKIVIEYLESLLPYDCVLLGTIDNPHWSECLRGHDGDIYSYRIKRTATPFEVNLYAALGELKK